MAVALVAIPSDVVIPISSERINRMRKPLSCDAKAEDMTSPAQGLDFVGESRIERVKKILSSPLTKRKTSFRDKTFGVALSELVQRNTDNAEIPIIVKKICEFIERTGFHEEGLFRVSGNAKAVERLRVAFDKLGDANPEDVADVTAAAVLLKQFLRDLPEPVIPGNLHGLFVAAHEEHNQDREECTRQLKKLVEQLPEDNFNLLKYLIFFLVKVTRLEEHNRMGPEALGIVFGPNLFRVSDGLDGLREQAITNQIVTKFICDYAAIFEVDTQTLCNVTFEVPNRKNHTERSHSSSKNGSLVVSAKSADLKNSSDLHCSMKNDSDRIIEMSIRKTVAHHLFDEFETQEDISEIVPKPPPRHKINRAETNVLNSEQRVIRSNSEERHKEEAQLVLMKSNNIRRCNSTEDLKAILGVATESKITDTSLTQASSQGATPKKRSKEKNSRQGHALIPINLENVSSGQTDENGSATPDLGKRDWGRFGQDDDASEARRAERLQQFGQYQRNTPLKARRANYRSSRRTHSVEGIRCDADEDSLKENVDTARQYTGYRHHPRSGQRPPLVHSVSLAESPQNECNNNVSEEPRSNGTHGSAALQKAFSDSAASQGGTVTIDDCSSPNAVRKTYVPPLDLTTLHQHGDGGDPIPMNQFSSTWPLSHHQRDDDILLSPRSALIEMKNSFLDHNTAPSPPVDQAALLSKSMAKDYEVCSATIKHLSRRIQSLKRRIKDFEEGFEEQHGYRPSHAEKMSRSDVKKYMIELIRARKELKQLKDDARMAGMVAACPMMAARTLAFESFTPQSSLWAVRATMEDSLDDMLRDLSDKRRVASRPDTLEEMSSDQVLDEKVSIQKALLQFESVFGRPTSKLEKDLMKPIYDRYRCVKRMASKSSAAKDSGMELQPILEHETMDFILVSPKHHPQQDESKHSASSVVEENHSTDADQGLVAVATHDVPNVKKARRVQTSLVGSFNLHELTHDELVEQQWRVRGEKKSLRRMLKEFEEEFHRQTGRKVHRDDRRPMESIYDAYKQAKAKLKLLEALLSKHDHHYTM